MQARSVAAPRASARPVAVAAVALLGALVAGLGGCRSAGDYRQEADEVGYAIVEQQQEAALGRTEPFTIDQPEIALRQRLLEAQGLPHAGPASLGTAALEAHEHWPEDDYLDRDDEQRRLVTEPAEPEEVEHTVELTLEEALQVAAHNSRNYQSQKEDVYRAALNLDLEHNVFRRQFEGFVEGMFRTDQSEGDVHTGAEGTAGLGVTRRLMTGGELGLQIAGDIAQLLSPSRDSALGLQVDASIEIPLLRGAGRWIVTEPLTQAERDTVYAIYGFERFKRTFAVNVASQYLSVLQQLDQVTNAEENYRGVVVSVRRARAMADVGELPEVQVDQAVQDELRARNRWIQARESYERQLDSFKILIGLPTDAEIELVPETLEQLAEAVEQTLPGLADPETADEAEDVPPADAPIDLVPPSPEEGGPLELDPRHAIELALAHRLDLRVAEGEVFDAMRQVAVAANAFLPELTLLATGRAGERRGIGSATQDDARVRFDRGRYDALLRLDLPLERTAERNRYRNELIDLERSVREVQSLEDDIKQDVRSQLGDMLESRESLRIQAQAVRVAQRRVDSTQMLLELGRVDIRDVLEAQEALITAQNALTAALVSYRVSELELQRDLGLLEVDERGLWREYRPDNGDEAEPLDE